MMEEQIVISSSRYLELLNCEAALDALQTAGVDNWEGYDDAFDDLKTITELPNGTEIR